jgi:hypothetical protein
MHHEMDNPVTPYAFCFSHLPFEKKYTSNSASDNNHPSQLMTTLFAESTLMDGSIKMPLFRLCAELHTFELFTTQ